LRRYLQYGFEIQLGLEAMYSVGKEMTLMDIIANIRNILKQEAEAIENIAASIDQNFEKAIELMYNCKGKVVITGLGKSGLIGKKIAATLSSTGTPSFFVHAAEALHGDLGMIGENDVVFAISNSGETKELLEMLTSIRIIGAKVISMTGNSNSSLARAADVHIEIRTVKEADELNLAPTSSSTAALAVGDALAVVLSKMKGFREENFALFHPGGSLGKRLLPKLEKDKSKQGVV